MIFRLKAVAPLLLCLTSFGAFSQTAGSSSPVRILVITGGHGYEEDAFADVFRSMKTVSYSHAVLGVDAESKLKPDQAQNYDVLVFYDMYQKCEPYVADLTSLMEQGKGVVFLHHALGSCAEMAEYGYLIGGHARFGPQELPNTSKYKPGTSYRAHIEDPANPVTAGMKDFDVTDEVYSNYFVNTDAHILLTTDNPLSGHQLAWAWQYKKSPVVYIQLGHDHVTYENPNYRALVERAILWVGGRLTTPATAQNAPGEALYDNLGCAACHGNDARGARGPDLRRSALWARDDAEQYVFQVIKNGVKGSEMPPFGKVASDREIGDLIDFLAGSLRRKGAAIAGDVNQGREIYGANCARCHGPAGRGGLLGPELTSVVQARELEYLQNEIRHPDGDVPFSYAAISVTTKEGKHLTGVRHDEDTFSLQMIDDTGHLHLFQKDELRDIVHEKTPTMPGFDETRLPRDALLDVLAYLQQPGGHQ